MEGVIFKKKTMEGVGRLTAVSWKSLILEVE